jgi:hypothetical protein
MVRKADRSSKTKVYHIVHISHRDQVESPLTDWLHEAYEKSDLLTAKGKTAKKGKTD